MSKTTPDNIARTLQAASTHLNQGRVRDAVALSDSALKQNSDNVDALHISGLGRLRLGLAAEALPLLQTAMQKRKSNADIANNLALTHLTLGQPGTAARVLEPLAKKDKLPAAALNTLGDCRLRQQKLKQARACFEKALKLQPDLTPAMVNLGEVLRAGGDIDGAIQHYQNLLQRYPGALAGWRNLGLTLQEAERFSESIAPLEKYLQSAPDDLASWLSLGAGFFKTGTPEDALPIFDRVLAKAPQHTEALNSRGLALRALGQADEAAADFKNALELDPTLNTARMNLGNLLHHTQGAEAAISIMDDALTLAPEDPKTHMERGHILLQEGQIFEGWGNYRWRFRLPPEFAGKRDFPYPAWTGENLTDKTLLIWGEQGIGDEILYASMVHEIAKQAGQIILECAPRLAPIFRRSFPNVDVVARSNPASREILSRSVDYQVSSGDLCRFLRPDKASFKEGSAYLQADSTQRSTFKQRYGNNSGQLVVGIAWRSGRAKDGWIKTIPLDLWGPILSLPNVTFVSLQYSAHSAEIDAAKKSTGCDIIVDPGVDPLKDMDTFANQVTAMDLVISNSNAAAHVAGAFGVPVWTMAPHLGSGGLLWYWFKDGAKSPWYGSMTLYRQTRWQAWTDVIQNVADDLVNYAKPA